MPALIKVKKLKAGGDPLEVWQTLNEIVDAINDISVSIVGPQGFCISKITEGDIELHFTLVPCAASGDGGSQPTSGDASGSPTSGGSSS